MINIRREAYDIIVKVMKNNEYSDNLLHQRAKKLSNQDHLQISLIYQLVKGTIKFKMHLDCICRMHTDKAKYEKTDLKIKVLLYIGLYQLKFMNSIPDHAAINETVELAKNIYSESIAGLVNSVLRSYQRNPEVILPEGDIERIVCEYSYPHGLIKDWISQWGIEHTIKLAKYFNETPKLHIRVNTIATNRDKLYGYFVKRDISCSLSDASFNIIICEDATETLKDVAFSEGYFSVQDSSAALVVELLDPQPGESVLDLFSAPGGKCTYIAEKLINTGEVIAVDKTPIKMKLLKQAAEKLQLTNIKLVVKDAFHYGPVAPAYHRVLVDAPCSGWGVMGRKADLRWQQHQNIKELMKLQEKAISYAANFVKLNGCMVYSTCTMNPLENENQVENFLQKNQNFKLVNSKTLIPSVFVTRLGYFKTIPFEHKMDGAFAAKLLRIK